MATTKYQRIRVAVLIVVLACCVAAPCMALDIYVTITEDTNDGICGGPLHFPCSLRDAILVSNARPGQDDIWIPPGTYTLTIAGRGEDNSLTGDLDLTDDVDIHGSSMGATIIDGSGIDRVLHNFSDSSIRHLTVRGGNSSNDPNFAHGGGVANWGGSLWVYRCIVEGNGTTNGYGGGLYNRLGDLSTLEVNIRVNQANAGSGVASYGGILGIRYSTVMENYATDYHLAGAGGAIWAVEADVTLDTATISGNFSRLEQRPGGVWLRDGQAIINACTLADNDWDEIYIDPEGLASVTLRNTIIRGNCRGGHIQSNAGNIEGPGDTCYLSPPVDFVEAPIYLLPLGDHGGAAPTMPPELRPDNPAIDNIWATANCGLVDQRAVVRPQDVTGQEYPYCDSGAVELIGMPFEDGFHGGTTGFWSEVVP